jgi:hypothetical protein
VTTEQTLSEVSLAGLDCAYEFVRPAYDVVLRRSEIAEARARATLTFAGTLMFAAPAFVAATLGPGHRSFNSPWFVLGALCFVGVMLCLVIQQVPGLVGELQVISLRELAKDGYLQASPATFKFNLLAHAATAWDANWRHVNKLGSLATASAVLFGVQVAVLAVWVLLG